MVEGPILLFGGFAAFVVVVVVIAYQYERRRRAEFQAEATRLGLVFDRGPDRELVRAMQALNPIRVAKGSNPRAMNIMSGRRGGLPVWFFEFVYTVSTGKSSSNVYQTLAVARLPEPWPRLNIVPEGFGKKIWDALGGEDIDFESEEFSSRFWVTSDDRKFAYDVLHPRAIEYVQAARWDRWSIAGDYACLHARTRAKPTDAGPMLETLAGLLSLVPRFARPARERRAVIVPPTFDKQD